MSKCSVGDVVGGWKITGHLGKNKVRHYNIERYVYKYSCICIKCNKNRRLGHNNLTHTVCVCSMVDIHVGFKNEYFEVIGIDGVSEKRWVCVCAACNKRVNLSKRRINENKSCGCLNKKQFVGLMPMGYWSAIKRRAKGKKLKLAISADDISELFIEQKQRCSISNVPIQFDSNYSRNSKNHTRIQTASLDRIDSSKGYIKENVQWVHKAVNNMKNNMTDEEFIKWCKLVAENNK